LIRAADEVEDRAGDATGGALGQPVLELVPEVPQEIRHEPAETGRSRHRYRDQALGGGNVASQSAVRNAEHEHVVRAVEMDLVRASAVAEREITGVQHRF